MTRTHRANAATATLAVVTITAAGLLAAAAAELAPVDDARAESDLAGPRLVSPDAGGASLARAEPEGSRAGAQWDHKWDAMR